MISSKNQCSCSLHNAKEDKSTVVASTVVVHPTLKKKQANKQNEYKQSFVIYTFLKFKYPKYNTCMF